MPFHELPLLSIALTQTILMQYYLRLIDLKISIYRRKSLSICKLSSYLKKENKKYIIKHFLIRNFFKAAHKSFYKIKNKSGILLDQAKSPS